jgi:mannosyltransferase OCH1-like enzyme
LKENHADWKYILWTDEMNRNFIEKNYPSFLEIYDGYTDNIQRVDAVRYFILYEMGGVFLDMDFECIKNIDPILAGRECVFGLEPYDHCKAFEKTMIISNAFMACTPKNNFFKTICTVINNKQINTKVNPLLNILESTGPFKLTQIYEHYKDKHLIRLLPSYIVYPLTLKETQKLLISNGPIKNSIQDKVKASYLIHYFIGTWWAKDFIKTIKRTDLRNFNFAQNEIKRMSTL